MRVELIEQAAGQRATNGRRHVAVMLCGMLLAAAGTVCQAVPPANNWSPPQTPTGNVGVASLPDSGDGPKRNDTVGQRQGAEIPAITPHNITSWSNLSPSTSGRPLYKCTDGKGTSFQDTPCGKTATDQNHDKNSNAKPVY
jgi:hypothetical protein